MLSFNPSAPPGDVTALNLWLGDPTEPGGGSCTPAVAPAPTQTNLGPSWMEVSAPAANDCTDYFRLHLRPTQPPDATWLLAADNVEFSENVRVEGLLASTEYERRWIAVKNE